MPLQELSPPYLPNRPCPALPAFPGLISARLVVLALALHLLSQSIVLTRSSLSPSFLFACCPEQFRRVLPDNHSESGSFIPSLTHRDPWTLSRLEVALTLHHYPHQQQHIAFCQSLGQLTYTPSAAPKAPLSSVKSPKTDTTSHSPQPKRELGHLEQTPGRLVGDLMRYSFSQALQAHLLAGFVHSLSTTSTSPPLG